jgi:hypothetical protein
MANREKGEVSIEVPALTGEDKDGNPVVLIAAKSYTLRPTFDACCELETLTDKPVYEHINDALRGRLSAMRALVWCYLLDCHGDEVRTLKDASEWIDRAGGLSVVNAALLKLNALNGPEGEVGGDQGNPPSAQAGTGETPTSRRGASGSRRTSSGRARRGNTTAH